MSGRGQGPILGGSLIGGSLLARPVVAGLVPKPPSGTLRTTLFEAACDVAMEAEVDAAIEAALAKYDGDPEPPMISFIESIDDRPVDCESCAVCMMLNDQFGPAELVPLPDGTILEIRRRRSN